VILFSSLAHLCGEGWNHVGDACLRINSSRESYDNAKLYCYNLSGNLASLTTSKEVEFVLDEIQKFTQQVRPGTLHAMDVRGDPSSVEMVYSFSLLK
jgi:hypothetical protein